EPAVARYRSCNGFCCRFCIASCQRGSHGRAGRRYARLVHAGSVTPMATQKEAGTLPTAPVRRRRRLPLVWIVPLVTALLAVWLAWDTYSKRGPTITISFQTAAGLTAGQSQLKYKNVVMGTVQSIAVAPDLASVIVTVETTREAERLLLDTTVFWVVKPQLSGGNISGLDTLLSGSYIAMRPHEEGTGKPRQHFVGLEDPPILK